MKTGLLIAVGSRMMTATTRCAITRQERSMEGRMTTTAVKRMSNGRCIIH